MERYGIMIVSIGLLLCLAGVMLLAYCVTLIDEKEEFKKELEEVGSEVREMMKELGGDE